MKWTLPKAPTFKAKQESHYGVKMSPGLNGNVPTILVLGI